MRGRNRTFLIAVISGILLSPAAAPELLASARSKNRDGNRLYEEKKYDEALKRYTEAQLEAPDAPQLHYNLGNVLFRKGDLEKARDEYRRALSSADPGLDPRAIYNLGNTFFTRQEYKDAVAAYQRALRLDPSDADAKRNLELALLRMQQQQQQQQQKPQGDRKEEKEEQKQQQERPEPRGGEEGKREEAEEKGSREGERKEKGSLSKEEAERILNALQEDEKENLKKRMAAAKEEREEVEKDW